MWVKFVYVIPRNVAKKGGFTESDLYLLGGGGGEYIYIYIYIYICII